MTHKNILYHAMLITMTVLKKVKNKRQSFKHFINFFAKGILEKKIPLDLAKSMHLNGNMYFKNLFCCDFQNKYLLIWSKLYCVFRTCNFHLLTYLYKFRNKNCYYKSTENQNITANILFSFSISSKVFDLMPPIPHILIPNRGFIVIYTSVGCSVELRHMILICDG